MSSIENSPFDRIARCVEQIRSRDALDVASREDGPTPQKLDELMAAIEPVASLPDSIEIAKVWRAFKASTETEMSWLFPERDAISSDMIPALQTVQRIMGDALVASDPTWRDKLEKLANLHIVQNAAARQVKLRGNRISLGMVAARFLNKVGAKRTAESIADRVIRKWQS